MEKIKAEDLDLYYGDFKALKNINIAIAQKEVTAFIGPSGCGKSTLLKTFNRMNDLIESCRIDGKVYIDGQDIYEDIDVTMLRKRVGMVFQRPNPFPMSVYDNVAYGPRTHGIRTKAALDDIVERSLKAAAIWDELKGRLKETALGLSGGQQQRLCIARALGGRTGSTAHGRTHLRSGSHIYFQDRGFDSRTEEGLYDSHCHPQYAAGYQDIRQDGLLSDGRNNRIRKDRPAVFHAERQAD